ncbi:MAG: translation elongation factor 4 [Candidatus Firestonebacteria bacterium]|jgi:GTP-binding protein LepA|nr:translation elongation factor 4 [Candidatus Firestonebacteria bacterium]
MDNNKLRNFCIIAHIDHGKSTLADRLLEFTGAISTRDMKEQFLDKMELERERGITIKAKAVRLNYHSKDRQDYIFNLIDTPGHVDFTYEVSKSLFACEGALLIIDASQGVEAQTIANFHLAKDAGLRIIPVINKIDLQGAEPEKVLLQLEELGLNSDEAILASAKEGVGTEQILEAIVKYVPPPVGDTDNPLKALIFDSLYDVYKGVVVFFRIFDGSIKAGVKALMMRANSTFEVTEVGVFTPTMKQIDSLTTGEVGYFIANIKNVSDIKVGDTITDASNPIKNPLPGYKEIKPMVFCGFYPINPNEYNLLKDALEKLKLNDSSLAFEPESSRALGFGFRCGFLGLLHMEIIQERLEREYNINMIATSPNVRYKVITNAGKEVEIDNPANLPEAGEVKEIMEPYILMSIITPPEYMSNIMDLCKAKRGEYVENQFVTTSRVQIHYEMPMSEVVFDFFDTLKSVSKGYASMDYEYIDFRDADLVKLDIMVATEVVDALSIIVHRDKAYYKGKELALRLKEIIPRQMFEVAIQAAIGSKIIARESIPAMRKNVIAKCYGGDITRKRKLLEKQKEGKKRMKQIGRVEIPQEAFLAVLKIQ